MWCEAWGVGWVEGGGGGGGGRGGDGALLRCG